MSDKPATAQGEAAGAAIKGLFGAGAFAIVYAFIALIKGAMHINEKEVACPWSPGLIDFLLTYGIINISLPVLCIIMVLVGYCLRDTVGTKIIGFIIYVPVISYVVGFGLSIWGLVLLFSNSDSVTYVSSNANNYCDQLVHTFSMILSFWYVIMAVLLILFFIVRYIMAKRAASNYNT